LLSKYGATKRRAGETDNEGEPKDGSGGPMYGKGQRGLQGLPRDGER
jgi:hypothetical protein